MKLIDNDILGAALIGSIFLLIIVIAETWARKGTPGKEAMRKFIHINGGMASLLFPFLISSPYVVLILAAVFSILFFMSSKLGFLRSLNSVDRESRGSEYYPFAIWLLFTISMGRLWLYISSVLVLALADAGAALVGARYGVLQYSTGNSRKSLEGSLFFWIIAFIAIEIPMLLLTDLSRETCILSALLVSFLLTCAEAVSARGTDNIIVPVIACYVLLKITTKPVSEIMFQCASLFAIFAIFGLVIWRTRLFDTGAGIIFLVVSYASWSLGSVQWAVPALSAFILFTLSRHFLNGKGTQPVIRARALFTALSIPLTILIFADMLGSYREFFGLYLSSYAIIASYSIQGSVLRVWEPGGEIKLFLMASLSALSAWAAVSLPVWFVQRPLSFRPALAVLVICLVFSLMHGLISRKLRLPALPVWSVSSFLFVLAGAATCWILQYSGVIGLWNPV